MSCACSQSWAIEYHLDEISGAMSVGVTDIAESEARQRLVEAGFSDCGVDLAVFRTRLVGAVFSRCRLKVGPGSVVHSDGGGGGRAPRNRALIAAAVGGSRLSAPARRFVLSVAHLFNQVITARHRPSSGPGNAGGDQGCSEGGPGGPRGSLVPVCPPPSSNEVHHADILTEVYAIASLGLQAQVCQ